MTKDLNKEIQEIKYNHLNLPTEVLFESGDKIEWLYAADGSKLRKTVIDNGTVSEIKDYIGGFIYQKVGAQSKKLEFYSTAEGRVRNNSGTYKYEYDIKDHLGNARVSFSDDGGAALKEQTNDYYPFGLTFNKYVLSNENKFTYNGKEWEDDFDLNWYHYGARYYRSEA